MGFPKAHTMGLAVLAAAGWAGAHLTAGSLSIKAGNTFTPGQEVTVTWTVGVEHGLIHIDYSGDGGATWVSVKNNIEDVGGLNSYKMTMPNTETSRAKIKVCQGTRASCDTVKTEKPGSNSPYSLISPEFKIQGTSGINPSAMGAQAVTLDSRSGKFTASFALESAGRVRIQAFDPRGQLVATLLEGQYEAGAHRYQLPVLPNFASGQALLFRFQLGGKVRTQAWVRP